MNDYWTHLDTNCVNREEDYISSSNKTYGGNADWVLVRSSRNDRRRPESRDRYGRQTHQREEWSVPVYNRYMLNQRQY